MKKLTALILALAMCLSLAACAGTGSKETQTPAPSNAGTESQAPQGGGDEEKVVKIGVLLPFSGSSSYFGESQMVGYEHALEDFMNHYGDTLNGMKIELVKGDTAGVADTGVTEAERLINDEKVSAIIGTYNSGTAAAIAPIAIKYKTPFMVTNAVSDVILSEDSNYVFRSNLGDKDGASTYVKLLQWLGELRGTPITKVAILYEGTDYGQGAYNTFKDSILPAAGAEVVFGESFANNSTDLSSVLNKIKQTDAELIIPVMFLNDALLFTRQMKEYKVDIPVLAYGGGFLGDDYTSQAGEAAEYIMVSGSWIYDEDAMSDEAKEWCARFVKETGNTTANEPYANGWMGMYALLEAIARAGSADREAIATAIDETDIPVGDRALMFHATFGGIKYEDFDGRYNQNSKSGMQYAQVLGGRWKIIFPLDESPVVFPIPAYADR